MTDPTYRTGFHFYAAYCRFLAPALILTGVMMGLYYCYQGTPLPISLCAADEDHHRLLVDEQQRLTVETDPTCWSHPIVTREVTSDSLLVVTSPHPQRVQLLFVDNPEQGRSALRAYGMELDDGAAGYLRIDRDRVFRLRGNAPVQVELRRRPPDVLH